MAHFGVRLALACMSALAISARAGTPPSAMNMASGASSSLPGANNEEYLKRTSWGPELAAALKAPTAFVTAQDPYKRVVNKVLPGIGVCGPVSKKQAQSLWIGSGQTGRAPSNFSSLLNTALNTTIWGYPLVSVVTTSVSVSAQLAAEASPSEAASILPGDPPLAVNLLQKFPYLLNHSFPYVVAPNADNFYTLAFLDLSGGPLVFSLPDSKGRFNVEQTLDAYSNIPFTVGSVNTPAGKDVQYVIVPPGYDGPPIPEGYDYVAKYTTNLVWILSRIYAINNEADVAAAKALQDGITVTPLFPDTYVIPKGLADLSHDIIEAALTPVGAAPGNLSTFWKLLVKEAKENPPFIPHEQELLDDFITTTGVSLDGSNLLGLDPSTRLALNLGLTAGLLCIEWLSFNQTDRLPTTPTGWSAPANQIELDETIGYIKDPKYVGGFYTNVELRAIIARLGLGANPPKSAVYYSALTAVKDPNKPFTEQDPVPLDGSLYNYTITLPTYPNVTGFWSFTIYKDADRLFFGDTPYNKAKNTYRYNINGDTAGFDFNGGKEFTIYLSATVPSEGSAVYKNWLPIGKVPDSKFAVYLRLYGPDHAAQTSEYSPPPLVAHKGSWGEAAATLPSAATAATA
eukprot:jgi/Botrbrau1/8321/Bobra.0081s0010.1